MGERPSDLSPLLSSPLLSPLLSKGHVAPAHSPPQGSGLLDAGQAALTARATGGEGVGESPHHSASLTERSRPSPHGSQVSRGARPPCPSGPLTALAVIPRIGRHEAVRSLLQGGYHLPLSAYVGHLSFQFGGSSLALTPPLMLTSLILSSYLRTMDLTRPAPGCDFRILASSALLPPSSPWSLRRLSSPATSPGDPVPL